MGAGSSDLNPDVSGMRDDVSDLTDRLNKLDKFSAIDGHSTLRGKFSSLDGKFSSLDEFSRLDGQPSFS